MTSYDAIIIGTGAAGGIVAGVLAEAGKDVLLLERGPALSFSQVGRDQLRNQRLSIYGHNAGPELEGNPRVFVDPAENERTVSPHEADYHNNAACRRWRSAFTAHKRGASCLPTSARRAMAYRGRLVSVSYDDLECLRTSEWGGWQATAKQLEIASRRRDYPNSTVPPNPRLLRELG